MATSPQPDPHEVLGVPADADAETIRKAYRRLMRSAHPDHGGTAGVFRMVQAAYEALTDPSAGSARGDQPRSSWTPPSPGPTRSDPGAERRRAEKERIDEEFRRRRRQAYLDHPDDPWLAEFEARVGEEDRASHLSEANLIEGLREMIRRGMQQDLYPVPEYWENDMANVSRVARHQHQLRDRILRQEKIAEEAQAKAKRDARAAALASREKALGPGFVPAHQARHDLLALRQFRSKDAQRLSTLRLQNIRDLTAPERKRGLIIGIGVPALGLLLLMIDVALISASDQVLGSKDFAAMLFGLSVILGWVPGYIAYQLYGARAERLIKEPSDQAPYKGEDEDSEEWLTAAEQNRKRDRASHPVQSATAVDLPRSQR